MRFTSDIVAAFVTVAVALETADKPPNECGICECRIVDVDGVKKSMSYCMHGLNYVQIGE
jgi:hypothetical protein